MGALGGVNQDACCATVRRFLSARIGELLSIDERPELKDRNAPSVEEVWRSASHGFVVEHTRVEAFEGQIEDDIAFQRLVDPIEKQFAGALPGRFAAALPWGVASGSRVGFKEARLEIARLIAERVGSMQDRETVVLRSERLPYEVPLHKRHSKDSRIFFRRWIQEGKTGFAVTGDDFADDARVERIGRALEQKIPKLRAAADMYGLSSVLVLESNDIALSNVFKVGHAFKRAIDGRPDLPDLVFLVETDGGRFGWLLKDHDVVLPDAGYFTDSSP